MAPRRRASISARVYRDSDAKAVLPEMLALGYIHQHEGEVEDDMLPIIASAIACHRLREPLYDALVRLPERSRRAILAAVWIKGADLRALQKRLGLV